MPNFQDPQWRETVTDFNARNPWRTKQNQVGAADLDLCFSSSLYHPLCLLSLFLLPHVRVNLSRKPRVPKASYAWLQVFWRGSSTGGRNRLDNYCRFHRFRMARWGVNRSDADGERMPVGVNNGTRRHFVQASTRALCWFRVSLTMRCVQWGCRQ